MFLYGVGPLLRKAMRENRDNRLDPRVVETANDANDLADCVGSSRRVLDNRRANNISYLCTRGFTTWDKHMCPRLALGHDEMNAAFSHQLPHDLGCGALQHFDQTSFPSARADRDTNGNAIPGPQR